MSGNQTSIPYIQSQPDLNATQQNVNKVFKNLNNKIFSLQQSNDQLQILGEVKFSALTLSQFQDEAGSTWIAANGQSCVGTDYSILSGNKIVPNVSVAGVNAFIKVNT